METVQNREIPYSLNEIKNLVENINFNLEISKDRKFMGKSNELKIQIKNLGLGKRYELFE